jgi:Lon protease-like protein
MTDEIPLFPLNTVLLPGETLALHIFEPRYREMVGRCLEERRSFGVALIRRGHEVGDAEVEPHAVGTVARIARAQRFEDGRYEILIVGDERFRIVALDRESRPYQVAAVEIIERSVGLPDGDQRVVAIRALFSELRHLTRALSGQWASTNESKATADKLAYAVAANLGLDAADRQALLASVDPADQLAFVRVRLERRLPLLRDQVAAHWEQRWGAFGATN